MCIRDRVNYLTPASRSTSGNHVCHGRRFSRTGARFAFSPCDCSGAAVTVDLALGQAPTEGDDVILGTDGDDVINGLDGNDTICGEGGNDTINAGNGADNVFGGAGDDTINAGQGRDTVYGQGGDDIIVGGRGKDNLNGGGGDDDIRGNNGTCLLYTSPSPRDRQKSRMPSSA